MATPIIVIRIFWQEIYDAVCEGLDTQEAIKLLVDNGIYTPVILEHMEDYQAFRYIISYAPTDRDGIALEYAERIIKNDPKSDAGLEAGLYLGRRVKNPDRKRTYYRGVLQYHPNNIQALQHLAVQLDYDYPEEAIPILKKLNSLNPSLSNDGFGIAYERLGDYKTSWIYFKKEIKVGQNKPQLKYNGQTSRGCVRSRRTYAFADREYFCRFGFNVNR